MCADMPYSGSEGKILHFLLTKRSEDQDVFQTTLEQEFSLRPPSATAILKKMEQNGLIYRESVPYDARKKRILATPKAQACEENIHKGLHELEKQIIKDIDKESLDVFFHVIDKIIENLS